MKSLSFRLTQTAANRLDIDTCDMLNVIRHNKAKYSCAQEVVTRTAHNYDFSSLPQPIWPKTHKLCKLPNCVSIHVNKS